MDFINNLVAQFYAIPAVAEIVNSHAILRVATKQYGTPLLGLIILFVVLLLVLILSRLGKKSNKPKPVREKKQKPKKAPRQKAAKPAKTPKAKGPNKAIMSKLAKLPSSRLPLYPVADKRKTLDEALHLSGAGMPAVTDGFDQPLAAPEAVVDEASLIQGLDNAAQPSPAGDDVVTASFSLNDETAAQIMGGNGAAGAAEPTPPADDFDMPMATMDSAPNDTSDHTPEHEPDFDQDFGNDLGQDLVGDNAPEFSEDPVLVAADTDDDLPPLSIDPITVNDDSAGGMTRHDQGGSEGQTIDPVPNLDFDPIEPVPEEEKPMDDGDAIDIPVGSFGSGEDGDLSGPAQEKLAELNDRGVT